MYRRLHSMLFWWDKYFKLGRVYSLVGKGRSVAGSLRLSSTAHGQVLVLPFSPSLISPSLPTALNQYAGEKERTRETSKCVPDHIIEGMQVFSQSGGACTFQHQTGAANTNTTAPADWAKGMGVGGTTSCAGRRHARLMRAGFIIDMRAQQARRCPPHARPDTVSHLGVTSSCPSRRYPETRAACFIVMLVGCIVNWMTWTFFCSHIFPCLSMAIITIIFNRFLCLSWQFSYIPCSSDLIDRILGPIANPNQTVREDVVGSEKDVWPDKSLVPVFLITCGAKYEEFCTKLV
ncbi:hypothetical protein K438DRAFT_1785522 [Mycena galopus ATCC 62051]|nr:hypothetical protein K438DRAFT_1785522 [Mycena galopus ATCC 62051]